MDGAGEGIHSMMNICSMKIPRISFPEVTEGHRGQRVLSHWQIQLFFSHRALGRIKAMRAQRSRLLMRVSSKNNLGFRVWTSTFFFICYTGRGFNGYSPITNLKDFGLFKLIVLICHINGKKNLPNTRLNLLLMDRWMSRRTEKEEQSGDNWEQGWLVLDGKVVGFMSKCLLAIF